MTEPAYTTYRRSYEGESESDIENTWSGEPHSVTMGKVVDDMFEYGPIIEKYDSEEAAIADGVSRETIDKILATFRRVPGMTTQGYEVYQPGAKPCFITDIDDVPFYNDENDEISKDPSTNCSEANSKQPAFNGRQALFNSGIIPYTGDDANEFEMKVAKDATPGTYNYFCTYHWIYMAGELTIAEPAKEIPSRSEVIETARREIRTMERPIAAEVAKVKGGDYGKYAAPLAGLPFVEGAYASVNEFYPRDLDVKVGDRVSWSVLGATHTISFNVPKYFPLFSLGENGDFVTDPRADKAVGWEVPEASVRDGEESAPRVVDVGKWDGGGGFRSSGSLNDGDLFSVTFTKPGTYAYACLLHPPMIGTVKVSA